MIESYKKLTVLMLITDIEHHEAILVLRSCLNIQSNHVMNEMFDSIKIAITKTLKIQKKEDIKDKKNMLYIVVTQIQR